MQALLIRNADKIVQRQLNTTIESYIKYDAKKLQYQYTVISPFTFYIRYITPPRKCTTCTLTMENNV